MKRILGALGVSVLLSLPFSCGQEVGTPPTRASSACPAAQSLCEGGCIDLDSSPSHCGTCDSACTVGEACVEGACQCLAGFAPCATGCVDLSLEPQDCGSCGHACAADEVCSAGTCAANCQGGLSRCGSSCVDLQGSATHCGVCDHACAPSQTCVAGACQCDAGQTQCASGCTNTSTDGSNCGSCGMTCPAGVACVSGTCQGGSGGASAGGSGGASTGGTVSAGGTGGATTAGGGVAGATGGGGPSGGTVGSGGTSGGAGAGGAPGSGGTTGGAGSATGGSTGTGGSPGGCQMTPVGSCASPEVRITDVSLGVTVISNGDEGDTRAIPLAIAALPGGGSRVAAMSSDGRVYVAELDCNDRLVGSPFTFPANDFQDIALDAEGGVVLLTRDAQGGGTLNCGTPANLCDGGPNPAIPCYDMYLVRFDNRGTEQWATKLTTSSSSLPPYSTGPSGGQVHMIWWYQHHGRIASDGTNYAAYFCEALSVSQSGCINIHEADRMQVVGPTGSILSGHDSFDLGCSHSWNTRIVWDPAAGHFVTVCATDNQNRVARSPNYQTIFNSQDLASLSMGNIVLSSQGGYWVSVSDQGTIRLLHFTASSATPDQNVTAGSSGFSHLVSYGSSLLVAWESGSSITAQVRSSSDAGTVSSTFSIGVSDHRYQDFKSFPDGSVAYPAQGANNQSIRIARVMPCQ